MISYAAYCSQKKKLKQTTPVSLWYGSDIRRQRRTEGPARAPPEVFYNVLKAFVTCNCSTILQKRFSFVDPQTRPYRSSVPGLWRWQL